MSCLSRVWVDGEFGVATHSEVLPTMTAGCRGVRCMNEEVVRSMDWKARARRAQSSAEAAAGAAGWRHVLLRYLVQLGGRLLVNWPRLTRPACRGS